MQKLWTACLLGSMAMASACGEDPKPDAKPDYAAVSAILGGPEQGAASGSCAFGGTCHGAGTGKANLNFKGAADVAAVLVNVPACENSAMLRVAPGDPDNSWLWIKLTAEADPTTGLITHPGTPSTCAGVTNGFGTRMPQVGGFAKLADDKLAVIREWIEGGAPGPM
jgi:hypothetical protein